MTRAPYIYKDNTTKGDSAMLQWYEDEKKVIKLAEFLVQSVEIESVDELLEYFKHPDRYTEVWKIYEKEMTNIILTSSEFSKKGKLHEPKQHIMPGIKVETCACGIT